MTVKTLNDCAACPVVSKCDAHVSGGEWEHREGVDPCEVRLDDASGGSRVCPYRGTGCVSENNGLCFNDGECDPINAQGIHFTVQYFTENGQRYVVKTFRKHRKPTLIDAETANAALRIRTMGRQFERVNGTTAEEFLSERGL